MTLASGDEREVAVIRRIFHEFAEEGRHEHAIAEGLNRDGILSPGGGTWDAAKVRDILMDERYAGTMVYNRTTQKLKTPTRRNPKDQWIRTPESFEPLIEPSVFAKAQQIFAERARFYTPDYMLEKLGLLFQLHGLVRSSLVRSAADMPSPSTYLKHFGSMDAAFQRLFHEVRTEPAARSASTSRAWSTRWSFTRTSWSSTRSSPSLFSLPCRCPTGLRHYWFFRPDRREVIDITLGVPLSEGTQPRILGYLALPRLLVQDHWIRLFSTSDSRLEMYGHNGLDIHRTTAFLRGQPWKSQTSWR